MHDADANNRDGELVTRAQAGDAGAFDALVVRHQARLRSYLARYLISAEDVFDVVQDAFLDAWKQRARVDPQRDFGAWLRGVARNCAGTHLRRRARNRGRERSLVDEALLDLAAQNADAAEEQHLADIKALRDCVAELPQPQRRLLARRYVHGEAVQDIARSLSKQANTLSMTLLRLRAALRSCLERARGAET